MFLVGTEQSIGHEIVDLVGTSLPMDIVLIIELHAAALRHRYPGKDMVIGDQHARPDQKSGAQRTQVNPSSNQNATHRAGELGGPLEERDRQKIVGADQSLELAQHLGTDVLGPDWL